MSFWKEAPPPEEVMEMEPEELAPFILRYLQQQPEGQINRYNFSQGFDQELYQRLGNAGVERYARCLMEGWMWLEREGFVAPQPGTQDNWSFVTRKGRKIVEAADFDAYAESSLFPANVDPVLTRVARPPFVRGDYDTAVFSAFKEVEVRVRAEGGFADGDIGVDLMRRAFGPTGPLTNGAAPVAEQERVRDLFVGAIGCFKNPSSHRNVQFEDPGEAADMISFANQLLRMVDRAGEGNE